MFRGLEVYLQLLPIGSMSHYCVDYRLFIGSLLTPGTCYVKYQCLIFKSNIIMLRINAEPMLIHSMLGFQLQLSEVTGVMLEPWSSTAKAKY